ncbi:TOPRIM nucleotidyl transferase/hydrolase domain-containing protein (plasmid) [Streptomyces sp. BI20]|uniref:TOPRIM nucleotidyl transferase/hydrolase domain-containing protein n=1 Tax=Streptomyces sp. BI20 TaxID=3403460 RepID=UPI003C77AD66
MGDMEVFRRAVVEQVVAAGDGDGDGGIGHEGGGLREVALVAGVRTVVLVEGPSDVAALAALAERRGRDLEAEGVCVLAMNGAMSVGRFAPPLGPSGAGLRLLGLCDEAELGFYERAWERAGAPAGGIFVCAADLEDELIRALGVPAAEEVVRSEGELRSLRIFVRQPAQQDRDPARRLRRFLGTRKGRKIRYGRALVEALAPGRTPAPLEALFTAL